MRSEKWCNENEAASPARAKGTQQGGPKSRGKSEASEPCRCETRFDGEGLNQFAGVRGISTAYSRRCTLVMMKIRACNAGLSSSPFPRGFARALRVDLDAVFPVLLWARTSSRYTTATCATCSRSSYITSCGCTVTALLRFERR